MLDLRTPNGIRTRVTALKGRRPRPLDDGGWSALNVHPSVGDVLKHRARSGGSQNGYPLRRRALPFQPGPAGYRESDGIRVRTAAPTPTRPGVTGSANTDRPA